MNNSARFPRNYFGEKKNIMVVGANNVITYLYVIRTKRKSMEKHSHRYGVQYPINGLKNTLHTWSVPHIHSLSTFRIELFAHTIH